MFGRSDGPYVLGKAANMMRYLDLDGSVVDPAVDSGYSRFVSRLGKLSAHSTVAIGMETEHSRGRVRVEPSHKRVRAYLGKELVADTTHPLLVWEVPYYPAYYIPSSDIRAELVPTAEIDHSPSRGDADVYDVKVARATAPGAARRYPTSPIEEIRDAVHIEWNAMDEWMEEDEPVYVHPRDPYTRVDILASSRHVQVVVEGETIADSHQPRILFETGLPPRYYLPLPDVRLDLLTPSQTETHCPTRARRPTGISTSMVITTTTSFGSTGRRCPRARKSPAWPRFTTRRSTCTSTACCRSGREPSSVKRCVTPEPDP